MLATTSTRLLALLALILEISHGLVFPSRSTWTTVSRGSPRFLFGGADEAPVPDKAPPDSAPAAGMPGMPGMPGMGGMSQEQIQEEMKLAMEYREKMQVKLRGLECKGEDGGVTVVFNGEQQPIRIDVSDAAMKAGKNAVETATMKAIQKAMGESQKAMQTTMMEMQKELMATLQASAPKK